MDGQMKRKIGETVWGCCYEWGGIRQGPMFGVLRPEEPGMEEPAYFEPIEPGLAIPLYRCILAGTKEECINLYNAKIVETIKEKQEEIEQMDSHLIKALSADKEEDGTLKVQPVWRADLSFNYDAIYGSMDKDLVPKEDCSGERMPWEEFVEDTGHGCLTDYDGAGDLLVDGVASGNMLIFIAEETVLIDDAYRIPFGRVPEVFKGHTVEVLWFNK